MSLRLLTVLAAAALATACSYTETRTVAATPRPNDSCAAYGYTPGTSDYNICAQREAAARQRGRMNADYAQARIAADSQDACSSYGLVSGTPRYDNCVQREISYRSPS